MASTADDGNGAALFEAANKLRGSVESAEYKHLVLGLIFLKYISDSFEARRKQLEKELSDPQSAENIEDAATAPPRWRTARSTSPPTSSGFRRPRAGASCWPPRRSPTSHGGSTTRSS